MSVADHIIKKCGGVDRTAELVGQSRGWVYRWRYEKKNGGTGGLVPRAAQEKLLEAASCGDVDISPADFFSASGGSA